MFEHEFAKISSEVPRRLESLPGLRLGGAIPKAMLLLPLVFFGFFLFFPLVIMSTDPAMRLAVGPAEFAPGRVESVATVAACRGTSARRVKYSFSAEGRAYRGAATVCDDSAYSQVAQGDVVEVRYLLRDPATNTLRTGRPNEAPPFFLLLMMPLFFLMIFAAMFWPSVRDVLRARRLFKNGRLVAGQVVFIKKRSAPHWAGMPGLSASEVFVTIPTSSNGTREVIAPCRNEWLVNQLRVGSTVHIACSGDTSPDAALLDGYLR